MTLLAAALVTGVGLGSMYGLIALGFHLTWAVSGTVNFAQGSVVMLGAVFTFMLTVTAGVPMAAAIPLALVGCALVGLLTERIAVRPFVERKSGAWLMATVALGLLIDNAVLFTFGKEPRRLSSPLATDAIQILGVGVFPLQLVIPVAGLAIAAAVDQWSRRTRYGKAFRAVTQNPDAARLMGIDVKRTIALAFALSSLLAGMAGILIAPLFNVAADMGTLFGIKAFAVAILGGIGSAWGVVLAGFLFGVVEATITAQLGSVYTQILSFALVIAALAARPDGLFGTAAVKKV